MRNSKVILQCDYLLEDGALVALPRVRPECNRAVAARRDQVIHAVADDRAEINGRYHARVARQYGNLENPLFTFYLFIHSCDSLNG